MRISGVISEINTARIQADNAVREKIYIWPAWPQKPVEAIKPLSSQDGKDVYLQKADREFHKQIIESARNSFFREYTASGNIQLKSAFIKPGTLFDAIV